MGEPMSSSMSVAIIGCGIFGAMTALRLAARGASVTVYERQPTPLQGASNNNQNRLDCWERHFKKVKIPPKSRQSQLKELVSESGHPGLGNSAWNPIGGKQRATLRSMLS